MSEPHADIANQTGGSCGAISLTIRSNPASLPIVRAAVERLATAEGFGETDARSLVWALDEALTNVIRHGYENQPNQPIELQIEPVHAADGREGLRIIVRDYGRQVDPSTIKGRDLDDVRPGGLGVHVIRSVMDEVEYSQPRDGGMRLSMVKYVRRGETAAKSGSA